jgi:hypothetical protein
MPCVKKTTCKKYPGQERWVVYCVKNSGVKNLPVKKTREKIRSVKKLICKKKNKFVKNILWDRACLV